VVDGNVAAESMTIGGISIVPSYPLSSVTDTGNVTPHTIEFTNAATGIVTTGNVVVAGNVTAAYLYGDASNVTGIASNLHQIVENGNVTSNTVQFTNATTGIVVESNIVVAGNVTAAFLYGDVSNVTGIASNLHQIVENGNVTSNTVQFTNATTGLVTTANVEIGGELTVTGNVAVDTDTLFVDSVNNRVGIGTTIPGSALHVVGDVNVVSNVNMLHTSNTASIKLNSNVVVEFPRSKKLIKYPRVALTQNALNNGYAAEASSESDGISSGQAYRVFDGNANGERGYHSAVIYTSGSTYDGSASITDANGTQHQGEWIKLQMPTTER